MGLKVQEKKRRSTVRLKLNNLKVYGREQEVALLFNAYSRIKGKDAAAQVVMVNGISGSGKTAIVNKLHEAIKEEAAAAEASEAAHDTGENETTLPPTRVETYFVSGKFDQHTNAKPFSALVDALTELFDIVIGSIERENYKNRILESLQDEWRTLAQAIPRLANLLEGTERSKPLSDDDDEEEKEDNDDMEMCNHGVIRLKALFRALLGSLCSEKHPIVMFLDDLQFGDEASLDLIDSLLTDRGLQNILFVSAYRSDEVTDSLAKLLTNATETHEKQSSSCFTSISVSGLDVDSITQLLANVTSLSCQETLPLAQVVLRKTRGNIFFVLEFLKAAQQKRLIYYSTQTLQWTWDVHKLDCEMSVSNNVVDLLIDRLHSFPKEVQTLLIIASCIGAQFDATILATLYDHKDETPDPAGFLGLKKIKLANPLSKERVTKMLNSVEEQELVMAGDKRQYMFAHDRVQQASYMLLENDEEKCTMQLRVGLQLLRLFHSRVSQRWMLFVAVNNLNRSSGMFAVEQKFELARLNLETGKRARRESAFLLAADYLCQGLFLLEEQSKWTDHYKLTLELYSLSAEMEYTGGNCKKAETMAQDLIKSPQVKEHDKLPLYFILMRSTGDQLNLKQALDTGIQAVTDLSVTIPRRPGVLRVLWDLRKTDKLTKGMTGEEFLWLPKMTNQRKKHAMRFLCSMIMYCWSIGNDALLAVIFMKALRLSVQYGTCEYSPIGVAGYGLLLASLGRFDDAFRFGDLAMHMLDKDEKGKECSKVVVSVIVNAWCSHWRRPMVDGLDPLLEGHHVGIMQSGDIAFACVAAGTYCVLYMYTGLPLAPFALDARKFIQCMHDFDQLIALVYAVVPLQMSLNLMGESDDPFLLNGEAMNEEEFLRDLKKTCQTSGLFSTYNFQQQLAYILGDIDTACKHSRALWALNFNAFKGHVHWNGALFFSGLVELAYARKHGAKKAPKRAMKYLSIVSGHEREGGINQHPVRLLLEAESATFVGNSNLHSEDVRKMFDKAIAAAIRSGFINFAAIANERAAEYMLDTCEDEYWGKSYMTNALDCYSRWGAKVKVSQIRQKYRLLLGNQSLCCSDNHLRGVERVSAVRVRGILDMIREDLFGRVSAVNLRGMRSSTRPMNIEHND